MSTLLRQVHAAQRIFKGTMTGCIIQARMKSTRLPGKAVMMLEGKPVLEWVIGAVLASRINETVLATTDRKSNQPLVKIAEKYGIESRYGKKGRVLKQFKDIAQEKNYRHIVRITGDCPCLTGKTIDYVLNEYFRYGADYATNSSGGRNDGLDVQVFSRKVLNELYREGKTAAEKEHVCLHINKIKGIRQLFLSGDRVKEKLSLDTKEDYRRIEKWLRSQALARNGRRPSPM